MKAGGGGMQQAGRGGQAYGGGEHACVWGDVAETQPPFPASPHHTYTGACYLVECVCHGPERSIPGNLAAAAGVEATSAGRSKEEEEEELGDGVQVRGKVAGMEGEQVI